MTTVGECFHQWTRITPEGVPADQNRPLPLRPPRWLSFPHVPFHPLSRPAYQGMSVETALQRRRSVREYSTRALTLHELALLCLAAQGITAREEGYFLRSSPSAGARYPCELYLVVHRVAELPSGIYHYHPLRHGLEQLHIGDFRSAIYRIGLEQSCLFHAAVVFVITAVVDRVRSRYGERGWRYIYMEAGHISQNLYLQATSLGLGSVAVGAFFDQALEALLGLDGHTHVALYLHAVGPLK